MKKTLLRAVALMVTTFFVGTTLAEAASVQIGGQLRPRFEINEQSDFNEDTDADYFVSSRIRLNAKADILPDTSAFIQLQSVRVWGDDLQSLGTNPRSAAVGSGGTGNAAFSPNDNDDSVGVHQAYFTLKNFATLPVDLQVGRQEVTLDGHRILGNTGWTQGAQTHDAVRVTHAMGNHTLAYVYSLGNEEAFQTSNSSNDNRDIEIHVLYGNLQGILGGSLSLYFVGMTDGCSFGDTSGATAGSQAGCISDGAANVIVSGGAGVAGATDLDNDIYTIGVRQAGQLFGIDYRGEFYYQFGDAAGDASNVNNTLAGAGAAGLAPFTGNVAGVDRSAYMIGARVGKKFNSVMWKPSVTLWFDYLSGTSDDDAASGDFNTFNTLFDTGHKFYGFMDLFLPASGANTNWLGLVDYAIKGSVEPADKWVLKADWHYFTTAEGPNGSPFLSAQSTVGTRFDDNDLGHELDLTLVHKYNSNTTISAGFSNFWAESLFHRVNSASGTSVSTTNSNASWGYVMFDVRF